MTEQLNLAKAQQRCEAYAAEHGLIPPGRFTNTDGTLANEAMRFREDSGLTLDWIFTGEGSKY